MKRCFFLLSFVIVSAGLFTSCVKECECEKTETKTLNLQPGPNDGQNRMVAYRETDNGYYASNVHIGNPDFVALRWTYHSEGAGEGTSRSYLKFTGLSVIPQDAVIKSAKLSLYGKNSGVAAPLGNSYYPGSPYASSGENKAWLKRVIGNWDHASITWNNKPGTTDVNQVEIPASTAQWNYDVTDIDVTNLVKDMVSNNQNFGFCMQLQVEQIYRSLLFASSEHGDATKRPKLVVVYEVEK